MSRLRPRLTYANVMVTVVAFVLLCGGGAYAATHLGKNSVGARQLKRSSVTSLKVKDGTLRPRDFAAGVLQSGAPGPAGAAGEPGVSHGYQRSGSVNYDKLSSSPYGSTVISLPVPAGAYFATVSAEAQTVNAVAGKVQCRLINGNGGPGSYPVPVTQVARSDGEPDVFTLSGLFDVSSGQSLNLQCSKSSPSASLRVIEGHMVAVQVTDATLLPESE
jgi:hypothetical protein